MAWTQPMNISRSHFSQGSMKLSNRSALVLADMAILPALRALEERKLIVNEQCSSIENYRWTVNCTSVNSSCSSVLCSPSILRNIEGKDKNQCLRHIDASTRRCKIISQ